MNQKKKYSFRPSKSKTLTNIGITASNMFSLTRLESGYIKKKQIISSDGPNLKSDKNWSFWEYSSSTR